MSDPFKELEEMMPETEEKTFEDLYHDFKKYLGDVFKKLDVAPFEWREPVTGVTIK